MYVFYSQMQQCVKYSALVLCFVCVCVQEHVNAPAGCCVQLRSGDLKLRLTRRGIDPGKI